MTSVQTKISAQSNMVWVRVGQGCGLGASIGHGQEVGAVYLLKLELDLQI